MSMFKKAEVIMLPTNKPSKLGDLATYQGKSLAKVIKEGVILKNTTVQFWNLYIISDDEIKEGDWIITNIHNKIEQVLNNQTSLKFYQERAKKVIATTDTSLYIHQKETYYLPERVFYLPSSSQQFIQKYIEEYNKGHIITDVLVEYEYLLDDRAVLPYWNLKINTKDNTITIKKLKETYTKEELCQVLEKYTSFLWSEVGIHYPISLGNAAKDKFINNEL